MSWFRPELAVLFVCTANVCRSPLAEALLRRRLQVLGLGRRVRVRSAGTSVGQPGRPPDPRVQKLAAEVGVSLSRIRARQLTPAMLRASHFVLVMEARHREEILAMVSAAGLPDSVQLLGRYLPPGPAGTVDIPDPYYGTAQGFVEVFEALDTALNGLVDEIVKRLEIA